MRVIAWVVALISLAFVTVIALVAGLWVRRKSAGNSSFSDGHRVVEGTIIDEAKPGEAGQADFGARGALGSSDEEKDV